MQGVRHFCVMGEGTAVPVDLGGVRLIRHRNSTQFFQGLFQLGPGKVVPPGGVLGAGLAVCRRRCSIEQIAQGVGGSLDHSTGCGSCPGRRLLHSAFGIPGGGRGFPQQGFQLLEGELSGQVLPAALHSRRQGRGFPAEGQIFPGRMIHCPAGEGHSALGFDLAHQGFADRPVDPTKGLAQFRHTENLLEFSAGIVAQSCRTLQERGYFPEESFLFSGDVVS